MDNARVAIFEDNEDIRDLLKKFIESEGHQVVGVATSLDNARELIDSLPEDGLDVATVDGNLSPRRTDGEEGKIITSLLHAKFSSVCVLGMSGTYDVVGADINLGKPVLMTQLLDTIAEL